VPDEDRLECGPAYGRVRGHPGPEDWPTYRHDAARSGCTRTIVPADLKPAWQTQLGGRLTSLVISNEKVYVASVDTHTLYALNEDNGEVLWSYTVGGRVDSPPTIYNGRVLFGSADGWVYCLRASDGELIWRFQAAPQDLRLTSFEQLESVASQTGLIIKKELLRRLCHKGVKMLVNTKALAINNEGVIVERFGENEILKADTIVLAVGYKPRQELVQNLDVDKIEFYQIGDCTKPRTIMEAIEEGNRVGFAI